MIFALPLPQRGKRDRPEIHNRRCIPTNMLTKFTSRIDSSVVQIQSNYEEPQNVRI
jgi:hypothetical protein